MKQLHDQDTEAVESEKLEQLYPGRSRRASGAQSPHCGWA